MKSVNILIVDDETMFREGLRALLAGETFVNAIYEAGDEESFTRQLATNQVHIVLLDVGLRQTSGLELIKKIEPSEAPPAVIAVTGLDGNDVIINLLKAGVKGIVYKLDSFSEIVKTIKAVLNSETYFPTSVLRVIRDNPKQWSEVPDVVELSLAEKELLKAITLGTTTKEIADAMKMSVKTVETYRLRLMKKLGTSNAALLVAYAFRNGIIR